MPCRPAICSHSLGRAWVHKLPDKIAQAARYGLDLELFWEDVEYFAKELSGGDLDPSSLTTACHQIRQQCDELGIAIVCLQPFMHYEGLWDRAEHARRIDEMRLWIDLAKVLDTRIISIPSTTLGADIMSGDLDLIVADMREVADLGALAGIVFAYESLCWGTYNDTWEQAWEIVKRVDRPNFGICLDTFNLAGRVYADPASLTGKTTDAASATTASIARMVAELDVSKIVYVQVVDAERLAAPLVAGHELYDPTQPARMSWSRSCRLFYGEESLGAYLPVTEILQAILVDLGFEGWVSAELFNRSLIDPSPLTPENHARRAAVSWRKVVADFNLSSCEFVKKKDSARSSLEQERALSEVHV